MAASKAQRAKTAARREQAIALRLAGVQWEQIAERLGYANRAAACVDVNRALAARVAAQNAQADVLRETELMRLDRIQQGLWTAAISGDTKAADTVLRLIDRRIRLLALDAPQDMGEQMHRELTMRIAEQMHVVLARVLDGLGLADDQRALVPELMRAAIASFAASASPREIEGEVVSP